MRRAFLVVALVAGCRAAPVAVASSSAAPVSPSAAEASAPSSAEARLLAPAPVAPSAIVAESRARTPLRARWTVDHESPGRAVLTARVERFVGLTLPIEVRIEVPEGVTVASGETAFTVPASEGRVVSERQVTLQFRGTPAGDVVLEARTGGASFGITARDAYSFGRPRHERARPHDGGSRVVVGGRDFGRSKRIAP